MLSLCRLVVVEQQVVMIGLKYWKVAALAPRKSNAVVMVASLDRTTGRKSLADDDVVGDSRVAGKSSSGDDGQQQRPQWQNGHEAGSWE